MRLASRLAFPAVLLSAILCGCSHVDVHSSVIRGVAYVRVDDVIKHHPLYGQLSNLQDSIAAINLQAAGPQVPRSAADIQAQTKILNAELKTAQDRANAAIAQKQRQYQQQEQAAINAALAQSGNGAATNVQGQMSATSQAQAQAAYAQANRDMQSYQQSVVTQDNAASQSVIRHLNEEANAKLNARAVQYQQQETDLSLRLTQEDAPQRLAIKTKLNNLAMDDATHKDLESQLSALDKKEGGQVDAMRKAHAAAMSAYRTQVGQETSAAIKSQVGAIASQTRAKLQTRSAEVGAQIRSLAPAPPSANLSAGTQQRMQSIQAEFSRKFQADAQVEVGKYNAVKAALDRQFAALHGQDVGATGIAAAELQSLQQQHDKLQQQIVDQIQREATRIAKDRGFSVVFDNIAAAAGGYDLTNDLISDVESLHE